MKKHIICIAATFFAAAATFAKPATATLNSATVFLNGAELHHTVSLQLQKGDNDILIEGLAPNINQQSLQINIGKGVVISSYNFALDYLQKDQLTPDVKVLNDSIKFYNTLIKNLDNEAATTLKMQAMLQTGINNSFSENNHSLTSEYIEKNLTYFQKRNGELISKLNTIEVQKLSATERINALNKQLGQVYRPNSKKVGVLHLTLNSPAASKVKAEIKYFTYSAWWYASYDLNIANLSCPIDLLMKAHVSQTTGIDWNNVELTLSTASPSQNNQAPEFSTWRVSEIQPATQTVRSRNYAAKSAVMDVMPMMMAEVAVEEDALEVNTVEQYITQNSRQLSLEYKIDIPYTILGTGKEQTISLLQKQIDKVEYKYFAAPKLDSKAYLTANILDYQDLNLLDGRASLTYNGTFYGETTIQSATTNDKLRLTLGDDPQVVIKREKVQEFSARKTIGSSQTVTYAYKITIRNNKQQAVSLTLQENYPVSSQKDIQVELMDKMTTPSENDKQKGLLTYNVSLAPAETQVITLGYVIKYPKDMNINL